MKRTMLVLVLVAVALSVMGSTSQRAAASLVDDIKSSIFGGDGRDGHDVQDDIAVDWLSTGPSCAGCGGPPPSCSTEPAHAQAAHPAYNQELTATGSCTLSYEGPNLQVTGSAWATKHVYYDNQKCSGDPCIAEDVATAPRILVELLFGDKLLLACFQNETKPVAHCKDYGSASTNVPLGTLLECRVTAWANSASELDAVGWCYAGQGVPID